MNPDWQDFLIQHRARVGDEPARVLDFGDPAAELLAAGTSAILCDLSQDRILGFSGEDAGTFLQGQLTCDVREATRSASRPGALCTPKGRALAICRLWQDAQGYCMLLPHALAESVRKRLAMYVLRAKVKIGERSAETVRLGIAGPQAGARLAAALGLDRPASLPAPGAIAAVAGAQLLGLDNGRYLLIAAPEGAPALWTVLAAHLQPAGEAAWRWAGIAAREPKVLPATQEQFVPQMLNLDLLGGIGFQKGCYTGQEIVARTQYLGRLKQRMFHAHLPAAVIQGGDAALPQPGDPLYSADFEGQSTGMVVDAAIAPSGGVDLLAVIRTDSAAAQAIRLRSVDGPVLERLSLPEGAAATAASS